MNQASSLTERLRNLAEEEKRVRIVWGIGRVVALVLLFMLAAFFLDWVIDRYRDTPLLLRVLLWISLLGGLVYLVRIWILHPIRTGLSEDEMALWAESTHETFDYRLITAVQLNREASLTTGMSRPLINAVTEQAHHAATDFDFQSMVDKNRLRWTAWLLIPVFLLGLLCWVLSTDTMNALLARFFFSGVRIPRSCQMAPQNQTIHPYLEPVVLRFLVSGNWKEEDIGVVKVMNQEGHTESYGLNYSGMETESGQGIFTATIPAGSSAFTFDAWLNDARTYESGIVTFAPRPVVSSWRASVLLPEYCGVNDKGQRFSVESPQGDMLVFEGALGVVEAKTENPVKKAEIEFSGHVLPELFTGFSLPFNGFGLAGLESARAFGLFSSGHGPSFAISRSALRLDESNTKLIGTFEVPLHASSYRILVTDEHGFVNRPAPWRTIRWQADRPPVVTLLPDQYTDASNPDMDVEGMPIPIEKSFRIAYQVKDELLIDRAEMMYRVNDGPWKSLRLQELPAREKAFDLSRGCFADSPVQEQVEFHAIPSKDQNAIGRQQGGGRFDFQTRAIRGIKLGDTLEYYIAVYDRHPDPEREPGRSAVRRKQVVSNEQFLEWLLHTLQQEGRLRQLERQQRRVFEDK